MASICGLAVAERAERHGQALVDDLEVAAARELLELDEREVGLDAGRVAVHDEADGARGREDGHLGIAIAVRLAKGHRAVPRLACRRDQGGGARGRIDPERGMVRPSYSEAGAL